MKHFKVFYTVSSVDGKVHAWKIITAESRQDAEIKVMALLNKNKTQIDRQGLTYNGLEELDTFEDFVNNIDELRTHW